MTEERAHLIDLTRVCAGFRLVLEGLGLNPDDDPHLARTPERAAVAWTKEICGGYASPFPELTMFPLEGPPQMIVLESIPVMSVCAHHMLPFIGHAVIGYIPGKQQIFGVSKLSRVVRHFSARLQVQENLTNQIADALASQVVDEDYRPIGENHGEFFPVGGVGVLIRARHMCMRLRGVRHPAVMTTCALRGTFEQPAVRAEFLSLARGT